MKILVTGFEPFGGIAVNPSQAIVSALREAGDVRDGVRLVTEILPCEFRAAGERIVAMIRERTPDAVVSLGLAANSSMVRLERHALNLNDALRPDNGGDLATGRAIDPAGPIGYWATLPLDAMLTALKERDIPSIISNHAGAYVCNHVFYTARREIECQGTGVPSGFIHVPLIAEQEAEPPPGAAKLPLATLVAAVETCLDVLAAQIAEAPQPVAVVGS
jgi:pyroglutamyl-peptidase